MINYRVLFSDNFGTDANVSATKWTYVLYQPINNPSFFGRTQTRQSLPPISNGAAHLTIDTYDPTGPGNAFVGTDIYTLQTFQPGSTGIVFQVTARLDQAEGGLVGGIFPYALLDSSTTDHNEIDTELVSNDLTSLSVNNYADEPLGSGNPQTVSLPSGGSLTQWNTYQMVWLPNQIRWYVNGTQVAETTSNVPTGAMPLYLDFWVPGGGSIGWDYAYNSALQPVNTVAANTTYGFDVSSVLVTPLLTATNSFNGNGTSDILFQGTGQQIAVWTVQNGVATSASSLGTLTNGWSVAGTGSFYGTGSDDILFKNIDGTVAQWQMQNGQSVAVTVVGVTTSGWSIAGTGDFYGTGTDDILFRNTDGTIAQWQVQNGQAVAATTVGKTTSDWTIAAIGNLSGSGSTDGILFINSDGTVADWSVVNGQAVAANVLGQTSAYWSIVGLGDFTGNGQNDILFRGQGGEISLWLMQNGQVTSAEAIGMTTADWQIVGIGDYNGDGTSDILFRDTNGNLAAWEMSNGQVAHVVNVGATNSSWQIAPSPIGVTLPS